jgi:hypothetical protein
MTPVSVVTAVIAVVVSVARVVTSIPISVAITVTKPSKCFVPSITVAFHFTFLPRPALFPLGQFFFDSRNTLVHKLKELTFQSPTLVFRAV